MWAATIRSRTTSSQSYSLCRCYGMSSITPSVLAPRQPYAPDDGPGRYSTWRRSADALTSCFELLTLMDSHYSLRDIWDFVADIALGGDCAGDVPSSCWFWRVLYGNSAISVRLRRHADPAAAVFRVRRRGFLWHEDLLSEEIELLEGVELLPSPAGEAMTLSRFNWLKSQLFFLARYDSMLQMVRDQVDLELTIALDAGRMQDLIGAMNRYMTYGTLPVPTQLLFLWTDMGFERRAERARGQVSLGSVETDRFEVRRSFAVANHPDGELVFHGREAVLSSRDVGRHAGAHS